MPETQMPETQIPETRLPNNQAASAPSSAKLKPIAKKIAVPTPIAPSSDSATPAFSAKSYLLYDFSSKQTLLSSHEHERIDPAALTKLMTAYVSLNALRSNKIALQQAIQPDAEILRGEIGELHTFSASMYLSKNKTVTLDELLHGLLVLSANDAARVLAAAIAGSETQFAALMNIEAQRLNMLNTHFVNATGLVHTPGILNTQGALATGLFPAQQHYSTAADLALLAAALVRDFPDTMSIYSLREYQHNGIKQANRNRLLWMDPFIDGMELGNLLQGNMGSTAFSVVATAKRDHRRLIAVLTGVPSNNLRNTEAQKLLNHGFLNFETVRLYQKDQPVTRIRLWKGTESNIDVGFREDLFISIPTGKLAQLNATMETLQPLFAPISNSQKIGTLRLMLDGKPFGEYPLVALERVPVANILSRGWDNIQLLFQ